MSAQGVSADEYNQMQAAQLSEAQFQAVLIGFAQRTGWLVYHTHDSRRSAPGYPDLHLVHPERGVSMFRELKAQRKSAKLSADQIIWLTALKTSGYDVGVWRPLDWFEGTVQNELRTAIAK